MASDADVKTVDTTSEASGAPIQSAGAPAPVSGQAEPIKAKNDSAAGSIPDLLADGAEPVGDRDGGKSAQAKGEWPEDWRERLAGGDEKVLSRLKRYASPANVIKAWRDLEAKMSSGEFKRGLPADAKPEDIEAWRKENGIPDKPEGYEIKPPNGFVFGEADKPLLNDFMRFAHERNWTPEQVNQGAEWYARMQEQAQARRIEQDRAYALQARDELRDEWGQGFRAELNGVANFLQANASAEFRDILTNSRGPDGNLLGNNPVVMRQLAAWAREMNPAASVVPHGTLDPAKGVDNRLDEIKALLANDPDKYWNDKAIQAEHQRLLEAKTKMKARAA